MSCSVITKCIEIDFCLCALTYFTLHLFETKYLRQLSAVASICYVYEFDSNKLALAVYTLFSEARKIT
jgi:hypothetical protein